MSPFPLQHFLHCFFAPRMEDFPLARISVRSPQVSVPGVLRVVSVPALRNQAVVDLCKHLNSTFFAHILVLNQKVFCALVSYTFYFKFLRNVSFFDKILSANILVEISVNKDKSWVQSYGSGLLFSTYHELNTRGREKHDVVIKNLNISHFQKKTGNGRSDPPPIEIGLSQFSVPLIEGSHIGKISPPATVVLQSQGAESPPPPPLDATKAGRNYLNQ